MSVENTILDFLAQSYVRFDSSVSVLNKNLQAADQPLAQHSDRKLVITMRLQDFWAKLTWLITVTLDLAHSVQSASNSLFKLLNTTIFPTQLACSFYSCCVYWPDIAFVSNATWYNFIIWCFVLTRLYVPCQRSDAQADKQSLAAFLRAELVSLQISESEIQLGGIQVEIEVSTITYQQEHCWFNSPWQDVTVWS